MSVLPRTTLSLGNTSGLRPAAPETSVMSGSSTALPNPWSVPLSHVGVVWVCETFPGVKISF